MNKIVSSVVLLVFLTLAGLPLAAAATVEAPMACCRIHGAHHCADTSDSGTEHSFSAACPYHARAMVVSTSVATIEQVGSSIQLTTSVIVQPHQSFATASVAADPTGRAPPLSPA